MKAKAEKIKIRIIVPVFMALFILALFAVTFIRQTQSDRILGNAKLIASQAYELLKLLLEEETALLGSLNDSVRQNKILQQAWLSKNRQTLQQKALPFFNRIQTGYRVTHLYFIGLDKKCFLRVHHPQRHGDEINRLTLRQAMQTGNMSSGIELGPMGTLTLRVVYPWHINGRLAGYVELGQEIDHALENLHEVLGLELILMVKKELLDAAPWQQTIHRTGKEHDWGKFNDFVIISSTMENLPLILEDAYKQHISYHEKNIYHSTPLIAFANGREFNAGFAPLIDAEKNDIGEMFVLSDISTEQAALDKFTIVLVSSTLLVMLLLFFLFYRYLGNIEQRLFTSRQRILEESRARETALLEAKNTAEKTNRMKGQFLANMSHETRTPMNGVMGMLQVLNETPLSPEQQGYVKVALDSAKTLVELINDALDMSRLESGIMASEQTKFDLAALMKDIIDKLSLDASKKGLELSCHINPDLPARIAGDPDRLRQIMNKLIGNAIKFTPQGKITVRLDMITVEQKNPMLLFEVLDTGIGIVPELQADIFNTFTQADSSSTRRFDGSGLGLALTKQIIEQSGGEIGVKSTPGEGSCFYFVLPLVTAKDTE